MYLQLLVTGCLRRLQLAPRQRETLSVLFRRGLFTLFFFSLPLVRSASLCCERASMMRVFALLVTACALVRYAIPASL